MIDTWPKCSGNEADMERCYTCRASIAQAKKEGVPCA